MEEYKRGSRIISDEPASILKDNYGVTLVKSLIDVNFMNKAIQVMTEKNDETLALATLNYIFAAAHDLSTSSGPYVPKVCPDTLTKAMKLAISQISNERYFDLIDSGHLEQCTAQTIDCLNRAGFNSAVLPHVNSCRKSMKEIRDFLKTERAARVGYRVTSSDDCTDVGRTLGNVLLAKKCGLAFGSDDDFRRIGFSDLRDNAVLNGVSIVDESAKEVFSSFQKDNECIGILEGANAADESSVVKIKQYISETISACNNIKCTFESFSKNNYDLDCLVTENLTSENYVPDVTGNNFGWMHESIIMSNTGKVHALVENILGLREGALKEDILLAKRTPEDNDVNHMTLDPDKPITITGKNLQFVLGAAAVEKDYSNRKLIAERLAETVVNTIKWESAHENYSDLPIATYINRSQRILESLTKNTAYYNNLMETWKTITSKIEECAQAGTFNPCPTINELTPMPVGTRATQLAFNSIARADTDEDMDFAMMEFAKVYATMELFGKNKKQALLQAKTSVINSKIIPMYSDMEKSIYSLAEKTNFSEDIKVVPKNTFLNGDMNNSFCDFTDDIVIFRHNPMPTDAKSIAQLEDVHNRILSTLTGWANKIGGVTIECGSDDDMGNDYYRSYYIRISQKALAVSESLELTMEDMQGQEFADSLNKYHQTNIDNQLIKVYGVLADQISKITRHSEYVKYLKIGQPDKYRIVVHASKGGMTYYAEYDPCIHLDIPVTINNRIEFMKVLTFDKMIRNAIKDWCINLLAYNINVGWACDPKMVKVKFEDCKGKGYSNFYMLRIQAPVPAEISSLLETFLLEASAAGKTARKISRGVQKKEEKVIRKQGGAFHEIKQAAHNAVDPMEKYIGQMLQKLKKADADERREIIVKGGVMPKVLRWVKRSIGLIAGAAIGTVIPAAAVITGISLIGFIATDKMLDAKEKRKIIRELDDEITIVNEKIDDSRSDENKQNKYELMRIRNELQRTRERVLLNLKE